MAIKKAIIILSFFFLSCSASNSTVSQPTASPPAVEATDSTARINKVTLGMKREAVEELLGKPYSVEEKFSKDPSYSGIEITVLYSPKLRLIEQQIAADMKDNKNIDTTKSILSGALSILGTVVPSAGIASSVGSSTVNVAGDLASTKIDQAALDPSRTESAVVVYHNNAVVSLARRNLSSGPR